MRYTNACVCICVFVCLCCVIICVRCIYIYIYSIRFVFRVFTISYKFQHTTPGPFFCFLFGCWRSHSPFLTPILSGLSTHTLLVSLVLLYSPFRTLPFFFHDLHARRVSFTQRRKPKKWIDFGISIHLESGFRV